MSAKDASRGGRECTLKASLHFGFGDIPAVAKAGQMVSSGGYCACRICYISGVYYKNTTPNAETGRISGGHVYFPLAMPDGFVVASNAPQRETIHDPEDLQLRTRTDFEDTWAELREARNSRKDTNKIIQENGEFILPYYRQEH